MLLLVVLILILVLGLGGWSYWNGPVYPPGTPPPYWRGPTIGFAGLALIIILVLLLAGYRL